MPALGRSQDAGNLKVGVVAAITGPGSFLAIPSARAQMAIDRANTAGGVNGTRSSSYYDSEGSPTNRWSSSRS